MIVNLLRMTDEQQIENLAQKICQGLTSSGRARLYLRKVDGKPLSVAWESHKGCSEHLEFSRILGACEKRQRTVVILDANKDSLLRDIQPRTIQSAMGIPIFDEDKHLIGVFYVEDQDKVEAFPSSDKFEWERRVREFGPLLSARRNVLEKQKMQRKTPYDFLFSPLTLAVAGVLLLTSIVWLMAPADKVPPPPRETKKNATIGPHKVAEQYAQYLREGSFEQAWLLLDPVVQVRWPLGEFSSQHSTWVKAKDHADSLANREIGRVQRSQGEASVKLFPSGQSGDVTKWVWHLRETSKGWKLTSTEGGPVISPDEVGE